jgi:hypothetical protein
LRKILSRLWLGKKKVIKSKYNKKFMTKLAVLGKRYDLPLITPKKWEFLHLTFLVQIKVEVGGREKVTLLEKYL